jgi:NAD(P)-dependent dehydrogenase (short-subunit alcohol dehydrogenase family)
VSERVVVSGANRGLGLALARQYRARGDEVWAGCRRPADAVALREVTEHVHELDVGSEASIEEFAAATGGRIIDILVNNAGVDARTFGVADDRRDVLQLGADEFLAVMRVNALGPMLLARALLPSLRLATLPRIVNMSSQVGSMVVGATVGRDVGYSASKAALNLISVKLAGRLRADGVTVIAMHPGHLRTDMGGRGGDMDPADAAAAIVATVDDLTLDDSGSFLRWDGTVHPW